MKLIEIKQGKSVADLKIKYARGNFDCSENKLTSLAGAPTSVGGNFNCNQNQLTSLHNIHKQINSIQGGLYALNNPIKSHVLGVLLIKGLTKVEFNNKQVESILNRHLPSKGMHSVLEAQEELIDAGLEDFAQV